MSAVVSLGSVNADFLEVKVHREEENHPQT